MSACALLACLLVAATAHAATTYTVNTTADTVDAGGCVTASTCSLRDAVIAADAAGGGTITVPAGTYTLAIPSAGTDDPTTGDLDIDNDADVSITGASSGSTIIDAAQIDRAFAVQDGATLDIAGVTIKNGLASESSVESSTDGSDEYPDGGAIYTDGTLSLSDSTITKSDATNGAGIYADADAATTTITDSTLSDGFAGTNGDDYGGAIDLEGGSLSVTGSLFASDSSYDYGGAIEADSGAVTIADSTFSANSSGQGGALLLDAGSATISGTTFSDDSASQGSYYGSTEPSGGAIYDDLDGAVSISNSTFSGDSAGEGGAIAYELGGGLTISASVFSDDSSACSGGAIEYGYNIECDTEPDASLATPAASPAPAAGLTIDTSEITGSSAPYGGGLSLDGVNGTSGVVTIDDTTIDHNVGAYENGGGIYVMDVADGSSITDSTISDNQAGYGAGVYFENTAPVQFTNDTIADNTAGYDEGGDGGGVYGASLAFDGTSGGYVNTIIANNTGGDCGGTVGAADQGNNLDSDGSCFPTEEGAVVHPDATATSSALDLGPLEDNGAPPIGADPGDGALLTELPGAGSSAIDAGNNSACPATDERGTPSPYNGTCDIGAVEVAPAALSIISTPAASATTGVPFNDTFTVSNAGPAPSGQTVLTFTIPSGETLFGVTPAQGSCSTSGSTVTCDLGDVLSGASTSVTLVAAASPAGSYATTVLASNVEASTATGSATTQVTAPAGGTTTVTNTTTTSNTTTVSSTSTVTTAATAPTKPSAVTGTASKLALSGSTVSGEVTTGGATTTYFFEYGKTTAYGLVTPVSTTTTDTGVSRRLTNLTAGTTYHYRLIAVNASGQSVGRDRTFKTTGTHFLGDLLLDNSTLAVSHGRVAAKFTCDSSSTCVFRWAVTTNAEIGRTGRFGPALVTSGANPPVEIAAHATKTISYLATKAGLALLAQHGDRLTGRLTSRPLSHQGGLIKVVHLR